MYKCHRHRSLNPEVGVQRLTFECSAVGIQKSFRVESIVFWLSWVSRILLFARNGPAPSALPHAAGLREVHGAQLPLQARHPGHPPPSGAQRLPQRPRDRSPLARRSREHISRPNPRRQYGFRHSCTQARWLHRDDVLWVECVVVTVDGRRESVLHGSRGALSHASRGPSTVVSLSRLGVDGRQPFHHRSRQGNQLLLVIQQIMT